MNRRPDARGVAAYLVLVTGGSIAVALALPSGAAALALSALRDSSGSMPAVSMSTVAVLLLVRARGWRPRVDVPGTDSRTEPLPVLDPSGAVR